MRVRLIVRLITKYKMKHLLIISMLLVSMISYAQTVGDNYEIVETEDDAYLHITPATAEYESETIVLTTTKEQQVPSVFWLQGFSRINHKDVVEAGLIPAKDLVVPYAVIDGKYCLGTPEPNDSRYNAAAITEEGKIVPCIAKYEGGDDKVVYVSLNGDVYDKWK